MSRRIMFQSELVFAGPSPGTGEHFLTGNALDGFTGTNNPNLKNAVEQLHRIQSASYSFNAPKIPLNQYGQAAEVDNVMINPPTVDFQINYLLANFMNERRVGFDISTDRSCISGMLSDTKDERNFFVKTVPQGQDAINTVGADSTGVAVGVIGIGNAVLASYSSEASIGGFPNVTATFEGLNILFDEKTIENNIPAINRNTALPVDLLYSLPTPTGDPGTGDLSRSVIAPRDITMTLVNNSSFTSYDNPGPKIEDGCIQGYTLSFDLPRQNILELGKKHGCANRIVGPIPIAISIDVLANDLTTGDLSEIIDCAESYDIDIKLHDPLPCNTSASGKAYLARYLLRNMEVESLSYTSSIGQNKAATINFGGTIGAAGNTGAGLFMYDTFIGEVADTGNLIAANLILCAFTGDSGFQSIVTNNGGYESFDCLPLDIYSSGNPVNLHSGWSGFWHMVDSYFQIQGIEGYEAYTVGTDVTNLNDGTGFSSAWVMTDHPSGFVGSDNFSGYSDGIVDIEANTVSGGAFDSGSAWDGNWIFNTGQNLVV